MKSVLPEVTPKVAPKKGTKGRAFSRAKSFDFSNDKSPATLSRSRVVRTGLDSPQGSLVGQRLCEGEARKQNCRLQLQLQQTPPEPVSNSSPVQVIAWDPCRPWRGPAHQPTQLGSPLSLQGQLCGPHHLSLGVWGWGSQPAHQLVVRQAGLRLRLIRCFATKHPLAPSGLTCRPRLLPIPTSGRSVGETLQASGYFAWPSRGLLAMD